MAAGDLQSTARVHRRRTFTKPMAASHKKIRDHKNADRFMASRALTTTTRASHFQIMAAVDVFPRFTAVRIVLKLRPEVAQFSL